MKHLEILSLTSHIYTQKQPCIWIKRYSAARSSAVIIVYNNYTAIALKRLREDDSRKLNDTGINHDLSKLPSAFFCKDAARIEHGQHHAHINIHMHYSTTSMVRA